MWRPRRRAGVAEMQIIHRGAARIEVLRIGEHCRIVHRRLDQHADAGAWGNRLLANRRAFLGDPEQDRRHGIGSQGLADQSVDHRIIVLFRGSVKLFHDLGIIQN